MLNAIQNVLPAALSSLSRLQLCHIPRLEDSNAALPRSPSLRWLSTDIRTLLGSMDALQHATVLECVSIIGRPKHAVNWDSPAGAAFFQWLAHHPTLRRLSIEHPHPNLVASRSFLVQFAQLCHRRPALAVHFPAPTDRQSLIEYITAHHPF